MECNNNQQIKKFEEKSDTPPPLIILSGYSEMAHEMVAIVSKLSKIQIFVSRNSVFGPRISETIDRNFSNKDSLRISNALARIFANRFKHAQQSSLKILS